MWSASAVVTRSFGARDTECASTDDGLDRFHNRRLRTTKLPADGRPWLWGRLAATEHMPTLIAGPPRWLHDLSPAGSSCPCWTSYVASLLEISR
jgi:hypothetical protein